MVYFAIQKLLNYMMSHFLIIGLSSFAIISKLRNSFAVPMSSQLLPLSLLLDSGYLAYIEVLNIFAVEYCAE